MLRAMVHCLPVLALNKREAVPGQINTPPAAARRR